MNSWKCNGWFGSLNSSCANDASELVAALRTSPRMACSLALSPAAGVATSSSSSRAAATFRAFPRMSRVW